MVDVSGWVQESAAAGASASLVSIVDKWVKADGDVSFTVDETEWIDDWEGRTVSRRCENPGAWVTTTCPHGSMVHIRLRCGHCRPCKLAVVDRHFCRMLTGLDKFQAVGDIPISLVTLTTRPGTSWLKIMRGWHSLARELKRRYGPYHYVWIKETGTKNGMRHLHLMVVGIRWIDQAWLSEGWNQRVGAFRVDIRRMWNGRWCARYLCKYLVKGIGNERLGDEVPVMVSGKRYGVRYTNVRRVGFSEGWPRLPKSPVRALVWWDGCVPEGVEKLPEGIHGERFQYLAEGCDCYNHSMGESFFACCEKSPLDGGVSVYDFGGRRWTVGEWCEDPPWGRRLLNELIVPAGRCV